MDFAVQHPRFKAGRLAIRLPGAFSSPRFVLDGEERPIKKKTPISAVDDSGAPAEIRLSPQPLDPLPKVAIDGQPATAGEPYRWYEVGWLCLPLVLIFLGGAIGGAIGALAAVFNGRLFRSSSTGFARYGVTGLVSVAAIVLFFAIAVALHLTVLGGQG